MTRHLFTLTRSKRRKTTRNKRKSQAMEFRRQQYPVSAAKGPGGWRLWCPRSGALRPVLTRRRRRTCRTQRWLLKRRQGGCGGCACTLPLHNTELCFFCLFVFFSSHHVVRLVSSAALPGSRLSYPRLGGGVSTFAVSSIGSRPAAQSVTWTRFRLSIAGGRPRLGRPIPPRWTGQEWGPGERLSHRDK